MNLLQKMIVKIEQVIASVIFRKQKSIIFLCFHDICDEGYTDRYCIRGSDLKKIIDTIRDDVISINEVSKNIYSENTKYVISFDDGYASLYEFMVNHCLSDNIPYTAYISTDLIDQEGYLSKMQIVEMAKYHNCTIGSHMCSHSKTRDIGYKKSFYEWRKSKKILEKITGERIFDAALPYGSIPACSLGSVILAFLAGYKSVAITLPYPICNARLLTRKVYDNESLSCFLDDK